MRAFHIKIIRTRSIRDGRMGLIVIHGLHACFHKSSKFNIILRRPNVHPRTIFSIQRCPLLIQKCSGVNNLVGGQEANEDVLVGSIFICEEESDLWEGYLSRRDFQDK